MATLGWVPWVHGARTVGTPGSGLRIEAMQVRLVEKSPPVTDPVSFAATADNGLDTNARAVFAGIGRSSAQLELRRWATWPTNRARRRRTAAWSPTGSAHRSSSSSATTRTTSRATACCATSSGASPTVSPSAGTYAKNYVVDRGSVRFIMIAPGILIDGARRTYADGTASQAWLRDQIRAGHKAGRWVVVGMHMPCLTLGAHGCASSPDLTDALIEEKVDLSLAGHDHNYIRSHQLSGTVSAPRWSTGTTAYSAGAGTVFAIVGNGGHAPRTVGTRTSLWAAASGTNSPGGMTFGFAQVSATSTSLSYRLVRTSGGTLSDSFTITR